MPEALRVGIDISRTLADPTGVGRYAEALVQALAGLDHDTDYLLYPRFWECDPPDIGNARVPPQANFRLLVPSGIQRSWRLTSNDRLIGAPHVVHSTAYTTPRLRRARLVVSVHDLSAVTYPHFHTEANRAFCVRHLARATRHAARILVPTDATRRDLQTAYAVDGERIVVVPYAAADHFTPATDQTYARGVLDSLAIPTPFVLFVGSVEPRKNLDTLLRAMAAMSGDLTLTLVVAGPAGWLNQPTHGLIDDLGLRQRVRFTGFVADEALRILYSNATVFAYPSFLEGFGLPVLEAMACGAPVVTSRTPALTEVAGDAALLVDPHDAAALRDAIHAVHTNHDLRARMQRQSLRHAARFSWRETARQTLAVYRELA